MHKKNIGSVVSLYPSPVTVIGTVVNGKVNWLNIAHVGIIGADLIMLSIGKSHYSNIGIQKNQTLSINLVKEEMIEQADYVGMFSGKYVDKSQVFEYFYGEIENAPIIKKAPISMECRLVDTYNTINHNNYILKVVNTYVDDNCIDEENEIDFVQASPVLFEMSHKTYLSTGIKVGTCWNDGKSLIK